ncbi:PspC domain-containing protein [Methanofollis fontis]|uniref:Phage shock protein PspC N-terminal domain-containing protein n=1 Tax=Methanofollis fontis TaxID=2052832 RepID=A0A483CRI6_9EURY|nr:PspC domain-containing protein [Methanofollis fontis]TAJ45438.1 hypothetical protein CUJ86_01505 [Methanofollis fontis]
MKRLIRPRDDRIIAGVCSGIARYLEIDPTVVRVLWALFALLGFVVTGVAAYLIAWFLIPEEEEGVIDAEFSVQEEREGQ